MDKIQTLKVWLQYTLPTVYDDSLTYQDLLYKVLAKLNEVIESQNYVVDFINTVDFQELVNNGLQDLVNDGTLASLINEILFKEIRQSIKPYYCVDEYGATGDGVTDDTAAFNSAITACPVGGTITTSGKTYKIQDLNITKSINIDLNGGTILDGQIVLSGSLTAMTGNINTATAIQANSIVLASNPGFTTGDIVFMESTEQYNGARTYYKKGGMFKVIGVNGATLEISPALPFALNANTTTIKKVNPITSTIKNGKITSTTGTYPLCGIKIRYGYGATVSGLNISKRINGILCEYNYQPTFDNVKLSQAYDGTTQDMYGIAVKTSTYATINNIEGACGQHCLTQGGWENTLYSSITNCRLFPEKAKGQYGYDEHENVIGTSMTNCYLDAATFASEAKITNTTFHDNARNALIQLYCQNNATPNKYYFDNCTFTSGRIQAVSKAQNGGSITDETYLEGLYFTNCDNILVQLHPADGLKTFGTISICNSTIVGIAQNSGINGDIIRIDNCRSLRKSEIQAKNINVTNTVFSQNKDDYFLTVLTADVVELCNCSKFGSVNPAVVLQGVAVGKMILDNVWFDGQIYGTITDLIATNSAFTLYNKTSTAKNVYCSNVNYGGAYINLTTISGTKYKITPTATGYTFTAL